MKQCPRKCEVCAEPMQERGACVAVMGAPDASQIWCCHRETCAREAVLRLAHAFPDSSRSIVVHVQKIERHDVKLISVAPRIRVTGGGL